MKLSLTPLMMFLAIVLVLWISVMFGKYINPWVSTKEGLVDFNNTATPLSQIAVPQYNSRKLLLVYDGIYYDSVNGNIVDVTSTTSGTAETLGNSITQFTVIDRTNGTKSYNVNGYVAQNVAESQNTTMKSISDCYIREETGDSSARLQYVYIPWDKDTYLHVMDLNTKCHVITEFVGYNNTGIDSAVNSSLTADAAFVAFIGSSLDYKTNGEENKLMRESSGIYNTTRNVYVVTKNVIYDPDTGSLILRELDDSNATKGIIVYPRSLMASSTNIVLNPSPGTATATPAANTAATYNSTIKYSDPSPLPSVVSSKGLDSMVVYDKNSKFMVLYIANGFKSVIAVFRLPAAGQNMSIQNVVRFDQFGAFTTGVSSSGTAVPPPNNENKDKDKNKDKNNQNVNDLWNSNDFLMKFFNYYYNTDGTDMGNGFSTDYMLKSQIVPPVCPMCPMCPSNTGVCTNCGGNGGSGTGGNLVSSSSGSSNSPGIGSGTANLARDAASGTANLARDAASGTANLARDAASGTVGLAKDTVGGTVGLAKDTVGGAVGLAKDTVGGAVGLAKDAVGGVSGLFSRNPTVVGVSSDASTATKGGSTMGADGRMIPATAGNDPYSYYGALPSKSEGKFIPITADFSAFGR